MKGTQSVFACLRGRVQAEPAFGALSAHRCIDFKVISVIRVTRTAASHTMKSIFEIVQYSRGRILAEGIFMFSNCRLLLVSVYWCYPASVVYSYTWQKTLYEKSFRYHNLWKYLHLFVLDSVHLLTWWHFKVLVEGSALTGQVSRTVMTFAADKCWICEEDCEAADWHYKLTAAGGKHLLMKKLSGQSGKSAIQVMYSPSLLTLFDWLWDFIFLFPCFSSNPFEDRNVCLCWTPACVTPRDPTVQRTGEVLYSIFFFWQERCHIKQNVIFCDRISVRYGDMTLTVA